MAFHAGNDTYLLKSDNALRTIWDAGGTDTLSAAGLGFGVTLDLHEAAFNRHGQHSTTAIAFGVTIERAVGSPFDDILIGNDAANRLDGGRGADRMIGGPGNDTYIVDRRGDVVEEGSDGGTDAVRSPISLALADNVERLTLLGSKAIGGRGNGLDNILVGNAGANRLFGGGGNDRLDGGLGVDSLFGGDGDDFLIVDSMRETVDGGPGHDKLVSRVGYDLARAAPAGVEELRLNGKKAKAGYGDAGDNVLIGSSADNTLSGRGGEDRLQGGLGADRLLGGPDSDTFVWQSRDERKDQITDLELGPGGDVMNVSAALRGYDPALDDPTDWVATSLTRTTLTLSIDPDGPGGALTFTALATAELPAVVPVDVATLIADGNLFLG
jgi:Ca2+-binding RTX toxin-like protein